jgi:hypothetical protein
MPGGRDVRIALQMILLLFAGNVILAQDTLNTAAPRTYSGARIACAATGASLIYGAGWLYANNNWYSKSLKVPFFFADDLRGYLQVDKFQHSFGSYYESCIMYHFLSNSGVSRKSALIWSAPMGLLIQSPKEFIDGHYTGGGFSWSDIAANVTGSLFFVTQEMLFREQVIRYKFSFSKSEYVDGTYGFLGTNLIQNYFKDYNGHTYWLTVSANRIFLKRVLPPWIGISAGYSANGMLGKFENREKYEGYYLPETPRYRQFLFSLDIDWTCIRTRSRFLKTLLSTISFIKLPFPAIEVNSLGKIKGYWIYF